jgi:hypothetical protein
MQIHKTKEENTWIAEFKEALAFKTTNDIDYAKVCKKF